MKSQAQCLSSYKVEGLYRGLQSAKEKGQSEEEWLKENTNFEDVVAGKVKEPWKPKPSAIGKILREWRGERYGLYSIAKEQNCRIEGLRRIEEGKDVTTSNLMHYLHFIKVHEPESLVVATIWSII